MKRTLAVLNSVAGVVLAAALFVSDASAAPVAPGTLVKAPDWSVGSEWHYSDSYAVKVASVSAKGAVFDRLDAPGQQFTRQGFIRTDSVSGTATRNAIYRTIPDAASFSLTAGKPLTFQREYLNNGKLLVHASSWTVEGRETITVPAGTFDCWVIVYRDRSLRSDWTGFERWWYSPAAQSYVRMEFKYGAEPEGSRVLMTYQLTGPQAVPPASNPAPEPLAATASAAPVAAPLPAKVLVTPIAPVTKEMMAAAPPAPAAPVKDAPKAATKPEETRIVAKAAFAKEPVDAPLPVPAPVSVKAQTLAALTLPAAFASQIEPTLPKFDDPLPIPASVSVKARDMAVGKLPAAFANQIEPTLPKFDDPLPLPAPVSVKARDMAVGKLPANFASQPALPELPNEITPPPAKAVQVAALPPALSLNKGEMQALVDLQAEKSVAESADADETPEKDDAAKPEPVKTAASPAGLPPSLPQGDKSGPWHAQLGASLDAANVRTSLKKILARNPGAHELPSGVTVRNVDGQTFYRAWIGSYASGPEARSLCDALNIKKVRISGCTVFKGPTTMEARAN